MPEMKIAGMTLEKVWNKFPKDFLQFEKTLKNKNKPELPEKIFNELNKEANEVYHTVAELPATKSRPYRIEFEINWNDNWEPFFNCITDIRSLPNASKEERQLVKTIQEIVQYLQYEYDNVEYFESTINNSPFMRNWRKKINKFKNKVDKLSKQYNFSYKNLEDFIS